MIAMEICSKPVERDCWNSEMAQTARKETGESERLRKTPESLTRREKTRRRDYKLQYLISTRELFERYQRIVQR